MMYRVIHHRAICM